MTIQNYPTCGGDHYGSNACPFIEAPCVVCGEATILACSDCAIDSGGRESVYVCADIDCRGKHEHDRHPPKPVEQWTREEVFLAQAIAFLSAKRHKIKNPARYAAAFIPQFIGEAKRVIAGMAEP